MAVPLLEARHGVDDMLESHDSILMAYEAEFGGADDGRERIADVGWRGFVVGLLFAVELVVVGDEPVVLLGDEAVEEVPCILGQPTHLVGLLLREVFLVLRELVAEPEHQQRCTAPGDSTEQRRHQSSGAHAEEHDKGDKHGRRHIVEPELNNIVAQRALGALGCLVAGYPRQQVVVTHPHAPAGTHGGIGVHPRLLGQQGELNQRAVDYHREAAHKRHIVAVALAETRQLGELADDEEDNRAGHSHQRHEEEPHGVYVDEAAEAHEDHHHQRQAEHRAAQVVEYLPAADGVHLVLHPLAALVAHMAGEPGDNLPVATRPAVVALGIVDVVGGVVVEEFDVVDETTAYVAALQQVVAQDEVLGEGALEHLLEHAEVVDALAAEGAFVEDVLVELEAGGGVDIQATQAGEELRVAALIGHFDVDIDARLHDAVAAIDTTAVGTQTGAIERMSHSAYELLRRIEHQLGVGVEGDNELYGAMGGSRLRCVSHCPLTTVH